MPAHEAVAFRHRLEGLERAAVDEAEVADVGRDVDLGERAHQLVEERRGPALEPGLARRA